MSKTRCAIEILILFAISWVVEYLWLGAYGVLKGTTLSVMEVSLSFDNAVLNAIILYTMSPKWRRRFIIWGIPIAVFGMRFVFPVLIVSLISGMDPVSTVKMAFQQPELYSVYLKQSEHMIMSFGGVFLMIIFIKWLYGNKENYWLTYVEKPFTKIGNLSNPAGLTILGIMFIVGAVNKDFVIVMASIAGFIVYEGIDTLKALLENSVVARKLQGKNSNNELSDIGKFLYLEVLDSSLSFDGVIAAFAISQDIVLIVVGLGVGAFAVRTLTIFFVENSVAELPYLENGAHWAIGFLGAYMLASLFINIPDYVVSLVTIGVIALAILSSLIAAKKSKLSPPKTISN